MSNGMWAVELCSNKILQFLTGVLANSLTHVMAVKLSHTVVNIFQKTVEMVQITSNQEQELIRR